jgi:ABC-type Mn2+/Zn2+ transport system permease subunit
MKEDMDISRRTWIAAIKLAVVISTVAAFAAVVVSTIGHVPDGAIVAIVAVVAFAVSWVQTGRVRSGVTPARVAAPNRFTVPAR